MKIKATEEGYRQWVQLRKMAANYRTAMTKSQDIYSTRAECKKKQCPYMMVAKVKVGRRLNDRIFCTITGKIVYSKVKCPMKSPQRMEAEHAEDTSNG